MNDPARPVGHVSPEVLAAFEDAPEYVVAEIIDGELHTLPRPRALHASAASRLARRLGPFFDPIDSEPGGWIILVEPELHLQLDRLVPDLAGWRRERMPELPDVAAFELAPDWVCEVISPGSEKDDRTHKRRIYRRERVGHLWFLSPELRTLEVYRLENGRWLEVETFEGGARVRAEPFESIELDLGALWAR
jgi:Uma2 family endonuclease